MKIVKPKKRRNYSISSEVSDHDAAVTNLRRSRRIRRQEPVSTQAVDSTDLGESEDSELEELLKEAVNLNNTGAEINEADLHRNIDELLEMDSDDTDM